jgi:hypothetical protein
MKMSLTRWGKSFTGARFQQKTAANLCAGGGEKGRTSEERKE